jgi:large repetitive protein
MKLIDFTSSKISSLQDRLFTIYKRRVHKASWITVLATCTLFSSHASFAQEPVLTGIEATALSYDEGQNATEVTSAVAVSDPDSPLLTSATIQISGNFSSAEDVLQFTDAFSITGVYDAGTGILTLSGPASPSDFENALHTVTYQNTNNDNPSNLVRTISISVNDGVLNSLTVTRNIQVNRLNDAPVGQPDSFVMYEDTDLDCGCLLSNDVDPDGDPLIALHGDPPAHGTVTDAGGFFIYTPDPDYFGPDTFTYFANDGTTNSAPIVVNILVLPVNDAPVAVSDAATTDEDVPVVIPVLTNDSDVDDVLTVDMVQIVSSASQGTVTINTTAGEVTYTPNLNYNGNDSFTYQLKDAAGALSNVVTVSIIINPINDAPVGNADVVTTPEDTPILITVLANDTDVENSLDASTVIVITGAAHGTAVVQSPTGTILYTPTNNFTGSDSFTYTVNDAEGVTSAAATVSITVTPVNDAPVANPDVAVTTEDAPISIDVLVNDTDVDNALNASSLVIAGNPASGVAVVESATGKILYTPASNFTGNDTFTYTVEDSEGAASAPATVTVTVTPVNDTPIANNDAASTPEETAVFAVVLTNDTDVEGGLDASSVTLASLPAHGTAVVQLPSGEILYTPSTNFTGNDTFTYTVNDLDGATSAAATVTITVTPVNDVPVANDDLISTPEDTPVSAAVLVNDTDVENGLDPSSLLVITGPSHGSAVVQASTGKILYTPANNFTGNDSFTYSVKDNGGASTAPATVTVTVVPVNDAPMANPDFATTAEETPISVDVLANDTDADNALNTNSVAIASGPANGTAIVQLPSGEILYTPSTNFTGNDTFTYTVNDLDGATSAAATVTITVTPVNDVPVANDDLVSTPEDTPVSVAVLVNDTDVENALDPSSLLVITGPSHGSAVVQASTGKILYTPANNFIGNDSFTYSVKDNAGASTAPATVTVTVVPVNDAPLANPDFATTAEETPISVDVLANDTDADNALNTNSLAIASGPTNGSAVVESATGTILYTPEKDYTGTDSFTYTVQDVNGKSSLAAAVTITVTPVNDPPVAVDDAAITDKNAPANIQILLNDYDVDNVVLASSVVITDNPDHGTLVYNSTTGLAVYTPETDYIGNDDFSYTIQDAGGLVSSPASVTVMIDPTVNSAPTAVDDGPISNTYLEPLIIDVLANDYDVDNSHDELSIVSVTNPTHGSVSIVNGNVVYQPAGLISGTVTFTYTIQDPSGLTDEAVVTIENTFLPLIVSEGFSPNSDDKNENWYIQGIENYPNNSVKVFDRWGFLVYQKQGYENTTAPWDGRGNMAQVSGKLLDQGTYYYILEPGDEMKTMTGYVVIVR